MKKFDVIIIGGSYAGMAAAMALGRAFREVLVIDDNQPANQQTPYAHNFLTHDGSAPAEIRALGRERLAHYPTIQFHEATAVSAKKTKSGFVITTSDSRSFSAAKLIIATGIKDLFPKIDGFKECWGISALHCPYCHGYEVANEPTAVLGNGDAGFELARMISHWTKELTLFTNGPSTLSASQALLLCKHSVEIIEAPIDRLQHREGKVSHIVLKDGTLKPLRVVYAQVPFEQRSDIPVALCCELTDAGYIQTDAFLKTTTEGVYACGDNASRVRTLANAVAMGTTAGIMVNKELIMESFL